MKIKMLKIFALMIALGVVFASFASCSDKENAPEDKKVQTETQKEEANAPEESSMPSQNTETQTAPDQADLKYGNAEVYEKGDKSYAKTDDGKEVELSNENMQKLLEEYSKVQGSGSEAEKELLNQLQVIIEAPRE